MAQNQPGAAMQDDVSANNLTLRRQNTGCIQGHLVTGQDLLRRQIQLAIGLNEHIAKIDATRAIRHRRDRDAAAGLQGQVVARQRDVVKNIGRVVQ